METHAGDKRYLSNLTAALRLRNISGARIGEILAEVETYTADSGNSALEAFGTPSEYAQQFDPTAAEPGVRKWGRQAWTGALAAAICAWLFASGAFAGMAGADVIGIPGWWARAVGGCALLITFGLMPIDVIVDPRQPAVGRHGRMWFMACVTGAIVIVLLAIVGLMWVVN